ncbi:cell division ATP-binding protein FtsE [Vulgatibacter sp.]|uniref:cell division ATP-binding protein FtsE n=1 Tax=Vulgatibacter sp. TaxID=1971226 RepID=UPI003567047F
MIELYRLHKLYKGEVPALDDVNLVVGKGEFVFLTGSSGAGKSTLLRLIMAAEEPTRGQIIVGGRNLARIDHKGIPFLRRNMGVVFQDFKLLPTRTVFDNVALTLEVLGTQAKDVKKRVDAILERVSLGHKAGAFPPQLSGGEQQRVAIARALVGDPAILLADEPTGNLDPQLTIEVMDLLTACSARGTTVLVATHDHTLLERYKKRTVRLEAGKVAEDRP